MSGYSRSTTLRGHLRARLLRLAGAVSVGIFADGTYGAGWNSVGATTYLGKAGQGVTGLLHGDVTQFFTQLGGATLICVYAFALTFVVFKS